MEHSRPAGGAETALSDAASVLSSLAAVSDGSFGDLVENISKALGDSCFGEKNG